MLVKFYGRDYGDAFYDALRYIAGIAFQNREYNDEEYVRELMPILSSFPLMWGARLNSDVECVTSIMMIALNYLYTTPLRGKMACFSLLSNLINRKEDIETVRAFLLQHHPSILRVGHSYDLFHLGPL